MAKFNVSDVVEYTGDKYPHYKGLKIKITEAKQNWVKGRVITPARLLTGHPTQVADLILEGSEITFTDAETLTLVEAESVGDHYKIMVDELQATLRLWKDGIINRTELLSFVFKHANDCRDAQWLVGKVCEACKKPATRRCDGEVLLPSRCGAPMCDSCLHKSHHGGGYQHVVH